MTKTIMIMIIMMTMIINENYENNNEVTQTRAFLEVPRKRAKRTKSCTSILY